MSQETMIRDLIERMDSVRSDYQDKDRYYRGEQSTAYLSKKDRQMIDDRLQQLVINYPRLVVESYVERLRLLGFTVDGDRDEIVAEAWLRNRMGDKSAQAHTDALIYGQGYVSVWNGPLGPRVAVENPLNVAVIRDPADGRVLYGAKTWIDRDKQHRLVTYTPEVITKYTNTVRATVGAPPPPNGWTVADGGTIPNPTGLVPLVPIVNRGRISEVDGVSEMSDILPLADALNKLTQDSIVTSETYARPRRWVTGLAVQFDDDDNPVDPFSSDLEMYQGEDEGIKFGQFDPADMAGYTAMAALITQQIGAVSGLPPHYLGLNGDQPPSADSIRSAVASLVARALGMQRSFGQAWADVGELIHAVRGEQGVKPAPVWASAETRTPAQDSDAVTKLHAAGIIDRTAALEQLGWNPDKIKEIEDRFAQSGKPGQTEDDGTAVA
ncbi:MAG: phage portal protein [Brevibacterium sp.]|nr:phage portal protein [Brevibacterium sp.]